MGNSKIDYTYIDKIHRDILGLETGDSVQIEIEKMGMIDDSAAFPDYFKVKFADIQGRLEPVKLLNDRTGGYQIKWFFYKEEGEGGITLVNTPL